MRAKGLWIALLCAAVVSAAHAQTSAPAAPPLPQAGGADIAGKEYIIISFCLYRVNGDVEGETSLTDNIWAGMAGEKLEARKGRFTFFTLAKLELGGKTLSKVPGIKMEANEKGWTWNGQEQPPKSEKVVPVSSPKVAVLPGQGFTIMVGSKVPIQYFEKRSDGLFELKQSYQESGFSTSGTAEVAPGGRIILRDLTFQLRTVEAREPIDGVFLDVGRPHIRIREDKTTVCLEPGRDCGMMLDVEGYGCMIIRVRADLKKPE